MRTRGTSALVSSFAVHWIAWTLAMPSGAQAAPSTADTPETVVDVVQEPIPAPDEPIAAPPTPVYRAAAPKAVHRPVGQARIEALRTVDVPTSAPASSAIVADQGPPLIVGGAPEYQGGSTSAPGSGSGGWGLGLGGRDLSRPARLGGQFHWNRCPWPEGAPNDGHQVIASVAVEVAPDGSPVRARVMDDPGHGFGDDARRCAMQVRYVPGLGPNGKVARMWTIPFRVIFDPWFIKQRSAP